MLSLGDISSQLLTEQAKFSPNDNVLLLSAEDPILIHNIAQRVAAVDVYDSSYTALHRAEEQTAARVKAAPHPINFSEDVFPPPEPRYNVALMTVPKGRDF